MNHEHRKIVMISKWYQDFVLVLLWPVLILATDDSSGRLQDSTEVSDGIILFANVFSFPHHKLDSRPLETHAVNSEQDCIEICSQISRCRSLNFKHGAEESDEFDCHLLDNDKFNSSALFEKNPDFHHYSLAAPCYHNPCKNGGKCRPVIEKYDFNCQCTEHFGGKKCDLPRISQGSNVCTWFLENGSNKSGIYQVAADGTDIISIFCDQTNQGGGWTMVFKLVAGVSADISRLWSSGDPLNENNAEVLNTTSTPKEHYKNRMIRNWNTLGLREVRVVLYKSNSEALSITFNATGTDNINWFAKKRVTKSPWTDLGSESQNIFSNIDPHAHSGRSFHINRNYGGCTVDAGWLLVTEGKPCEYEEKLPPIVILYSKLHNYTNWNFQENVGTADVLVVFVR